MLMDLSDIRARLNAAVMGGGMDDYVRDVSHLLTLVYGYQDQQRDINARIAQARVAYGLLKASAADPGSDESPKRDRELLWHGGRQVARALSLDPEDDE